MNLKYNLISLLYKIIVIILKDKKEYKNYNYHYIVNKMMFNYMNRNIIIYN